MLRLLSNLRLFQPVSLHNHQTVRWARKPRKPRWMPTAKSKMFKIPERIKYPEEENKEVLRLFNNYRTAMKSIKQYLTNRYNVQLQAKSDTEQLKKAFEEDFARCSSINDKWNEQIRKEREVRIAKELQEEIEFSKNRKAEVLRQRAEELEQAEEIVRKEKQAVASLITPEQLDEVIERAINNPVDYNFAIDLDGNRIYGRETMSADAVKAKQ
ncbi:hypothetical protein Zmor_012519 [Zophobas morio]|uniref:Small ribosomal subunit protein mS26 n=1 Tax=Zophobas morio TaxID=2755281 RepID=A0AA38MEH1_9CUCU|nr:hypothetical protein Zmor_012519 [Zophobas morio]